MEVIIDFTNVKTIGSQYHILENNMEIGINYSKTNDFFCFLKVTIFSEFWKVNYQN